MEEEAIVKQNIELADIQNREILAKQRSKNTMMGTKTIVEDNQSTMRIRSGRGIPANSPRNFNTPLMSVTNRQPHSLLESNQKYNTFYRNRHEGQKNSDNIKSEDPEDNFEKIMMNKFESKQVFSKESCENNDQGKLTQMLSNDIWSKLGDNGSIESKNTFNSRAAIFNENEIMKRFSKHQSLNQNPNSMNTDISCDIPKSKLNLSESRSSTRTFRKMMSSIARSGEHRNRALESAREKFQRSVKKIIEQPEIVDSMLRKLRLEEIIETGVKDEEGMTPRESQIPDKFSIKGNRDVHS